MELYIVTGVECVSFHQRSYLVLYTTEVFVEVADCPTHSTTIHDCLYVLLSLHGF